MPTWAVWRTDMGKYSPGVTKVRTCPCKHCFGLEDQGRRHPWVQANRVKETRECWDHSGMAAIGLCFGASKMGWKWKRAFLFSCGQNFLGMLSPRWYQKATSVFGGHHGCLSAWSYSHLTSGRPTEPQAVMEMVQQKTDTVFSTVPPVWVR